MFALQPAPHGQLLWHRMSLLCERLRFVFIDASDANTAS